MFQGLRDFLDHLDRRGLLAHIKKEVNTKYEIAAGIRKASDTNGPALLFEKVAGYPGWKVAAGIFATRRLVAEAFELPEREVVQRYLEREDQRIPPVVVKDSPGKEVVWTGKDVDLYKLPIVTHSELDCGPYITIGIQVGKHPDTGIRNVSIHRLLLLDRDKLSCWAPPDHHLGRMILQAEDSGKGLPIATAIGVDPLTAIASQSKVPMGVDEFDVAGGFHGAPVELVRCETIDVEVPAHCEIIIEAVTIPGERCADGPFAEYPGTYSETKSAPVMRVTAITMRRDAIYQTGLTGFPLTENHTMIEPANAAAAFKEVRRLCPEVKAVNITPGGTSRHHCVVSIRKRHEDEGRNVVTALLAANLGIKLAIVVDEDIDVFNS
ncbi:MAG: UbiD family decarboxylase, partial [Deltaproteobacteria bacterium]|nr:UbiD family decarboxylase [Deltaproteobacteria bacterium]